MQKLAGVMKQAYPVMNIIPEAMPRGDMRFKFIEGTMNSTRFILFLKQLRGDAGKPIIVVVDNARYHHSKETQAFIAAQEGSDQGTITLAFLPAYSPELNRSTITLAFLPAYSPELNPDEQVWNHLKARLGKLPIASKEVMKRSVLSILRSIQKSASLSLNVFSGYVKRNILLNLFYEFNCATINIMAADAARVNGIHVQTGYSTHESMQLSPKHLSVADLSAAVPIIIQHIEIIEQFNEKIHID